MPDASYGRISTFALTAHNLPPGVHRRHSGRSYGVRAVNGAGACGPTVCGFGFGGGTAPAVVDVCVATHMRGLRPHDRLCEMRSGADLWRRAWPLMRLLTAFPRIAPRVGSPVRSPRRAVEGGVTPSSRAPSSVRRA